MYPEITIKVPIIGISPQGVSDVQSAAGEEAPAPGDVAMGETYAGMQGTIAPGPVESGTEGSVLADTAKAPGPVDMGAVAGVAPGPVGAGATAAFEQAPGPASLDLSASSMMDTDAMSAPGPEESQEEDVLPVPSEADIGTDGPVTKK